MLQGYVDVLSSGLRYWYSSRVDTDPEAPLTPRWAELFGEMGQRLEQLIDYGQQQGITVQLAPSRYNGYSGQFALFPNGSGEEVIVLTRVASMPREPGDDLLLPPNLYGPEVLCVGDDHQVIPLNEVAGRLTEGARLDLITPHSQSGTMSPLIV